MSWVNAQGGWGLGGVKGLAMHRCDGGRLEPSALALPAALLLGEGPLNWHHQPADCIKRQSKAHQVLVILHWSPPVQGLSCLEGSVSCLEGGLSCREGGMSCLEGSL